MPFIDLEEGFPNELGIYNVLVKTKEGQKEAAARWTKQGFILVGDILKDNEYIFSWFKN